MILPDGQSHGPSHWTRRWVAAHGYTWVEQHDWQRPLRGDWLIRLEEAVLATSEEVVLVAQGLGCALVAAWAAFTRHSAQVRAALLVAPVDVDLPVWRETLPSWSPALRQPLPFKSWVVGAAPTPGHPCVGAQALASAWGAQWRPADLEAVHAADPLDGDWPQGQALLNELMKD